MKFLKYCFQILAIATFSFCLDTGECGECVYWSDFGNNTIQRSNRDGAEHETIYTSSNRLKGLDLDLIEGKIFWVESVDDGGTYDIGLIRKSNLDGSSVQTIVTTDFTSEGLSSNPSDIAVDPVNQVVYWVDTTDFGHQGRIYRAKTDGSNPELIIQDFKPSSIELDFYNERIYWADNVDKEIMRAGFDGSGVELVLSTSARPFGLAIDPLAEHIYFSNVTTGASPSSELTRVDFDGTDLVVLSTIGEDVRDMEVAPDEGKVYWANLGDDLIQCSNLEGASIQTVFDIGLVSPAFVALDASSTFSEASSEIAVLPVLKFNTEEGVLYNIMASDTPNGPYMLIGRVIGDGTALTFTDADEMAERRFYKVIAN